MTIPSGTAPAAPAAADPTTTGFACALGAFFMWGVVAPVYFKALTGVGAVEILAHRIVWTVLLVGVLVAVRYGPDHLLRAVGTWRRFGLLVTTTALVSCNWTIFIHAIISGQLVQASLGYYINPLVNVLLGVVFLGERLSRGRVIAVLIAAAGVLSLVVSYGVVPWLALSLAVSFGFYGLVRKAARIEPLPGLLVETALLAPVALGYLIWLGGDGAFLTRGTGSDLLLIASGPMTAVPLILFTTAAARLTLSTLGLLQYLAPTGQLLLGVAVYGEHFTPAHGIAFGAIWLALALYSHDAIRQRRNGA